MEELFFFFARLKDEQTVSILILYVAVPLGVSFSFFFNKIYVTIERMSI